MLLEIEERAQQVYSSIALAIEKQTFFINEREVRYKLNGTSNVTA